MWLYGGREIVELVLKARFWPLADAREVSHLLVGMRMAEESGNGDEASRAEGLPAIGASYSSCSFFYV